MEITFWKENKLDQEYKLTIEEIKIKYKEYLHKKGTEWAEHAGWRSVLHFVGDPQGLNSTSPDAYEILEKELKPTRHEFYEQNF